MANRISFERYSSKTKRVNIPVPSFEFVRENKRIWKKHNRHSDYLIGRDRITEKLHSWLTNRKNVNGSFLITGYRGMGKTCFVNKVLYELTREADFFTNILGFIVFVFLVGLWSFSGMTVFRIITTIVLSGILLLTIKWYSIKECFYKICFLCQAERRQKRNKGNDSKKLKRITSKEWDKISRFIYDGNIKNKSYQKISVNINLGQEILDEREILCVLTSQLYHKYKNYIFSPLSNIFIWALSTAVTSVVYLIGGSCIKGFAKDLSSYISTNPNIALIFTNFIGIFVALFVFTLFASYQLRILHRLNTLRKRIDAALTYEMGLSSPYKGTTFHAKRAYSYAVASIREIESLLIYILECISRFPGHPEFYFVFDELDKIEVPYKTNQETQPEFSNERHLSGGGTSRKRKTTILHLLGNLKFFTSTAKAKFLFIAGREMYDAYLADMTDRESAISSLFSGVIYVESFCKNEKSEKDVMYNTETFIARQLLPHTFIKKKVIDRYIERKLNGKVYDYVDVNLKMYYEYLIASYSDYYLSEAPDKTKVRVFNEAREAIDKAIILLYHFTVYLYHVSNGSPKKMRMTFDNYIRPIHEPKQFILSVNKLGSPLDKPDLDIFILEKSQKLLSFGEKEQRVIGFIHYISFPVNQIFTDANQYGDKLLVSASFLINHIYKYHKGGFSWRNIEQTPELLEVYRIPEFRSFIESILNFLLQTHIIKIPCGLYQYKFRKHIAEEISLASKMSEEISAIFNFTLDESQTVKRHYFEILKNHVTTLTEEKLDSPHSISGIHHILGDLYMADEEYNNAIFEYQTALCQLAKESKSPISSCKENSHEPTFTLAYIRYMLKLGMAYEKRRTLSSAYNIYNEVIDWLFKFREFKENDYGLEYRIQSTNEWPYHDAILYSKKNKTKETVEGRTIEPRMLNKEDLMELSYKTKGKHMMSDFSYLMTPEKHSVIQRLAMLEDTHMIYQALLAKLFVIEKIELGGITRANLNVAEGEYKYLHLATNEQEKFLISTDFFRRLGDIMYYKNGLIGFNINQTSNETNANSRDKNEIGEESQKSETNGKGNTAWTIGENFVDSLNYWGIDIESEIHDYCRKKSCFEQYGEILNGMRKWNPDEGENNNDISKNVKDFIGSDEFNIRWNELSISIEDVKKCNDWRKEMWVKNRNLPCYACKYYNRSLRILMSKLFGINVEKVKNESVGKEDKNIKSHSRSKTIVILKEIIKGGSSKSMRQNYMIQMAELLDCLGNTMLSCSDITINEIRSEFLARFLHDINILNVNFDREKDFNDFRLLEIRELNKIETCILYYWEASVCFRYGNEQKKAAESIKKILRVIQNYLRVSNLFGAGKDEKQTKESIPYSTISRRKTVIGEFLNEIKNRLVKQSLICLYSHYNFINLMEIQRLKWIFYTQMYENISLDRLTLFPDVEEIMLVYYELITLCILSPNEVKVEPNEIQKKSKINELITNNIREDIRRYSRDKDDNIQYTWTSIEERNTDFTERLIGIYQNISMGVLSHHHTIYERILSLKFKVLLNEHILRLTFPTIELSQGHDLKCIDRHIQEFCKYFMNNHSENDSQDIKSEQWKRFFRNISFEDEKVGTDEFVTCRLKVLEHLIRDSIYCLTEILETITPYTSTTLFTNSFMGEVYGSLHSWTILFDALFMYYKVFDENDDKSNCRESRFTTYDQITDKILENEIGCSKCKVIKTSSEKTNSNKKVTYYLENEKTTNCSENDIQKKWQSKCPFYAIEKCEYKKNVFEKVREAVLENLKNGKEEIGILYKLYRNIWECDNVSDRFFESILSVIDKPNIHYTLSNYSVEMALKAYRSAIEVHREGKAYKDMISKMYYLDDDLKNDTVQFDLAIERFKINNDYIEKRIRELMKFGMNSLYDIENFCKDNESRSNLHNHFQDMYLNVYDSPNTNQ